jgi:hypothetical protein
MNHVTQAIQTTKQKHATEVEAAVEPALLVKLEIAQAIRADGTPDTRKNLAALRVKSLARASPKIFPVDHIYRMRGCIEIVKQSGVHTNHAHLPIPRTIDLKFWAIAINSDTARWAKVVGNHFRLPAIRSQVQCRRREFELLRRVVRMQRTALGAE